MTSRPRFTELSSHNGEESRYKMYLSNFEYLHPFQRYSLSNYEVIQNRAKFCMFLAPKIFGGRAPQILDTYYLIEHTLHHHAKFCGDQPTEIRDLMVREEKRIIKNKCQQNISPRQKLSFLPGGLIRPTPTHIVSTM